MEELERQVGWAETFGLAPATAHGRRGPELFPLMSTERVLGATYLPTDGYLDPSRLAYVLAAGRGGRACDPRRAPGCWAIDVVDGAVRGCAPTAATSSARSSSTRPGMYAAEVARIVGVRVPIVPMSHQYVVTKPFRESAPGRPGCRRCATPTCSSTSARTAPGS